MSLKTMCPYCGELFDWNVSLIPPHDELGVPCPGSQQNGRNPESDGRPLWNGNINPHFMR